MNASTTLRLCIVIGWLSILGQMFVPATFVSTAPETVRAWIQSQENSSGLPDHLVLPLLLFIMVWLIISTIGLFCLRRWAAWTYLVVWLLMAVLFVFRGPKVESGLEYTLSALEQLTFGIAVGLAFFIDALNKRPDEAQ